MCPARRCSFSLISLVLALECQASIFRLQDPIARALRPSSDYDNPRLIGRDPQCSCWRCWPGFDIYIIFRNHWTMFQKSADPTIPSGSVPLRPRNP
ncbi:hypothetical protein BDW68DRAFT_152348, partial [Aspergillus falconensis]